MQIPTGKELREAREQRGLTQAELADRADVSQPLIARVESEDVDVTLSTLHSIVSALNESDSQLKDDEIEVAVPSALRSARKQSGYTQGELADAADVSQPLISRIEREDVNPRASTLRSLFEHLEPASEEAEQKTKSGSEPTGDSNVLAELKSEFTTFHNEQSDSGVDRQRSSKEGKRCEKCEHDLRSYSEPNFCPNCGAAVTDAF